ncbi:transport and Golgi organization protein 6 homolog [Oculina patagonica]
MATATEVLSFLRILTASASNATPAEKKTDFDEVLLSNMERLKDTLGEKGRFLPLKQRLENRTNALHVSVREFSDQTFCQSTEIGNPGSENEEKDLKSGKADLMRRKDEIRWTFVEICLELLKLLKESLVSLMANVKSNDQKPEQKAKKRGNEAPPLPADSLGVGDQKTVLTAIQFVVILGICPNLISGVGLPVEKRSGFASVLNIHCNFKSERRLFECINTLVDCISQPSLGALVLSRHLGDILSGLLQICYAPVSAYSNGKSDKTDLNCDCSVTSLSESLANHSLDDRVEGNGKPHNMTQVASEAKPLAGDDCCDQMQPSDVYTLTQKPANETANSDKLFITSSEREMCVQNLQQILDRVYQPIVIRELLMLQGGSSSAQKKSAKNNSGKENLWGENGKATGNQGMKNAVSMSQTPIWMRNVCGQLLSERLMKPNGVKAVLHALLEGSAGGATSASPEWKKCDVIAKVIANCPSQAKSVEEYYKLVSPQVLQLLHGQSTGVGRLFIRAASCIIMEMLSQYTEMAQKYVLSSIIGPLAKTTGNQEKVVGAFVDEVTVVRCIEDIQKVFVSGSHSDTFRFLLPIVHPVFELFCFTRKGVSHLRSALQAILTHILKNTEQCQTLQLLYTLAFKLNPPKNLITSTFKSSADSNTGQKNDKQNFHVPLMIENFVFAHGDNGGVTIIYQNDDADEFGNADGILRDLQGADLSNSEVRALCIVELLNGLKKDDVAGDFFICLMQELTNIISDFSDDMSAKDTQYSLLILHLIALMCEKLGHSILKNAPQMLYFIQSTLKRACAIKDVDQEGLGMAFVTETLTMALGMLSAMLGGAVEITKEHQPLVQDLLPSLEVLAEEHPSEKIQDMACDLRIAIATHGAVWSHRMDIAAKTLGENTDTVKVDSGLAASKGKENTNLKEQTSSSTQDETSSEFDKAFSQLCDPLLPVRGHAMMKLASLLSHRDPKAVQATDSLLKIFLEQLTHDDSYIYLAAIQGLVSLADVRADMVIPQLAQEFATCRKEAGDDASRTRDINEKGYYKSSETVSSGSSRPARTPELRMKLGEALVKATRLCGELVPRYSQQLLPALLTGVKDPEPLVRASSLSNLGDVCQLLRFSLGPVVHEIFSCVSSVLKTDKSAEVRRAAVLVITLLLRGLGKSIMEVLSSTLKDIYQLLKIVESTDADHVTRVNAQAALEELDSITRDYLFPKPSFTKRLQVLP